MGRRDEEAPAGGTYPRQTCLSSRSFPPDWPGSLDVLPLPCPALPCPALPCPYPLHSIPFRPTANPSYVFVGRFEQPVPRPVSRFGPIRLLTYPPFSPVRDHPCVVARSLSVCLLLLHGPVRGVINHSRAVPSPFLALSISSVAGDPPKGGRLFLLHYHHRLHLHLHHLLGQLFPSSLFFLFETSWHDQRMSIAFRRSPQ